MLYILGIALLATIAKYGFGILWYSSKLPIGKTWLASQGVAPESVPQKKMPTLTIVLGLVFTFISTFVLAVLLLPWTLMSGNMNVSALTPALTLATILLIGFIIPVMAQRKIYNVSGTYTWKTFLIDVGYECIGLILAVLVLVFFL